MSGAVEATVIGGVASAPGLIEQIDTARERIERLYQHLVATRERNAVLGDENRALKLTVERLQGALRRAAEDCDRMAEEHAADLRTRAAALRHEADRPWEQLL
ncbi:MAG: hypothetical protein AB7I38_11130 [Dehalococcoidia bacterium]